MVAASIPTPLSVTLKQTYRPGDIATLSVTFSDSKGNLAGDAAATTSYGIADNTTAPTIIGSNLTPSNASATTAATAADKTTNGVATYKFIVGSTGGAYQLIVNFPKVTSNNSAQKSILVPYAISDSSTSLNDVLKGIVSLIASINKQIAALAKLVTKK